MRKNLTPPPLLKSGGFLDSPLANPSAEHYYHKTYCHVVGEKKEVVG